MSFCPEGKQEISLWAEFKNQIPLFVRIGKIDISGRIHYEIRGIRNPQLTDIIPGKIDLVSFQLHSLYFCILFQCLSFCYTLFPLSLFSSLLLSFLLKLERIQGPSKTNKQPKSALPIILT